MTLGYEARIGRYGAGLASALIGVAGVRPGERVLDVGCGTGALTVRLAELLGPERVVGADPDAEALAKCGARVPGAQLHLSLIHI